MRIRARWFTLLAVGGLIATACTSGGSSTDGDKSGGTSGGGAMARNETLYTTGTQWGPPANYNPLHNWDHATGTKGLAYETLFHFDPNSGKLTPWLAESGSWTGDKTYELKLRSGIMWSDGKPMTAKDVVYSYEIGKIEASSFHTLWGWLSKAEAVDDHTVRFTFKQARYQEWDYTLYGQPIVPEHVWSKRSDEQVLNGVNDKPVVSGAYTLKSHSQDRVIWQRRDDWWGVKALNMKPAPKYIVDISNPSNEIVIGQLNQGQLDLSNNFLPGAASMIKAHKAVSYYDQAPYMQSANTAWLVPNTTKKPMNDAAFRKALAYSVDVGKIVKGVYGNLVKPADPTGLLPQWDKYIDKSLTSKEGFSFDTAAAKKTLADAGYKDTDGDGYVENKDGSAIKLKLQVPTGWTDWMEAAKVIAASAKAAGIRVTTDFPDQNALNNLRGKGNFDLVINNERQLSNTPWTYYEYMFQLPIQKQQNTVNFGRYENKDAWNLVQQLGGVRTDDEAGMKAAISKIQDIQLKEMPVIPLWYNGLWSQATTGAWTNWPSDKGDSHYAPALWRNWLEMGGFEMLTKIKPAH
ncbi:ABC transporter substrate-binding protein [Streptomyces sp. NBC_01445]|uniref:ABC transporter substrate-binding protein n=1 Tax=Streptomyces sp. NBC_01445 TaxID=2903869 RepID=UPI002DDB4E03|nr:ABC transporter substrate-binding protein [Streptomyces sp. NBC_01445]WSE03634.1 ABC transporter substrate-binding protein [Streptomyces sp. NBC_01445]